MSHVDGYTLEGISLLELDSLLHALSLPPFTFRGEQYRYGTQGWSERCVEIPIGYRFVERRWGQRILEFGNVLRNHHLHLPSERYTVLDKFEKGPGIVNQDIVDFVAEPFDALVSISTLEHVGNWEGEDGRPDKEERALDNLVKLVKPDGSMLVSIPWGYNPGLDGLLVKDGRFDKHCMVRTARNWSWKECTFEEAQKHGILDRGYEVPGAVVFLTRGVAR